jgi:hypothetical protein
MRIAIVGANVAGCIVARTLSRLGGADTKYVNSIDVAETEDGSASSPPPLTERLASGTGRRARNCTSSGVTRRRRRRHGPEALPGPWRRRPPQGEEVPHWAILRSEGYATALNGRPASKLSILSITCCQQAWMASWLAQPTWGVTITLGRPMMRLNG